MARTSTSPEFSPTRIWTVQAVSAAHAVGVLLHRLLHPQRRVARAHGVVLVGQGRAEQRHDAVAHHLVDGALVPVHGLHHVLEDGIEERAGLLGIAVGEQLHRALEIGEEHRDLLALALQRAPGGEDLLREVLRRVALRRAPGHRRTAEPLPTATTEPTARRVDVTADCACHLEPGAAAVAEARPRRILLLARRAGHGPRLAPVGSGIKRASGPCRGRAPRRRRPLAPRLRRDPRRRGRAGGGHPEIRVAALLHCSHTRRMTTILNVSRRGVVTLPAKLRQALGIKGDDQIIAEATPEGLLLRPGRHAAHRDLRRQAYEFDDAEAELEKGPAPKEESKSRPLTGRDADLPRRQRALFCRQVGWRRPTASGPAGRRRDRVLADGYVVEEARRNLVAKAPAEAPMLDTLLARMQVAAAQPHPAAPEVTFAVPEKDRPVLAAAIRLKCEALVTGDRTHFGSFYGKTFAGVTIYSPALIARALLT